MFTKWIWGKRQPQINFALLLAISTFTVASAFPQQYDTYQPSKVPDPLQKALDNPHFKPPSVDVAEVEETQGPLSQILLAPTQFDQQSINGKSVKKRSPTTCLKCGGGGGGGGLGGGGGIIGGFIGGFKKYGGGGGGGGYPGGGGGGYYPGGGGGGGYYPGGGGGGGYYPGGGGGGGGYHPGGGGGGCGGGCGGGGGGGSYASAHASANAGSYGK